MKPRVGFWAAVSALFVAVSASDAVQRFPRPDFASGYTIPGTTAPMPRGPGLEWLNIIVLVAALFLAGRLALRHRSRLGLWLLAVFSLGWFGFWRRGCICPVGSVQNVALAWSDSSYAIPLAVIVLFALPLIWTLFAGRTFCAAVCPLGAVQELVLWRPVKVPTWLGHVLGLIPWLALGIVLLFVSTGAGFLICRWDPFVGIFRFGAPLHMAVLGGVIIALSLFVGRPYCRFLCPYGALLGVMSRCSKQHVTITPSNCVQCRLCEEACPYGAIRKPVPAAAPESRAKGVRRLALILVLTPLVAILAGATGRTAGQMLSRSHPRVALAHEMQHTPADALDTLSPEREAFLVAGPKPEELFAEARAIRSRFAMGGALLGAWLALVVCGKLASLSIWRPRTDYEPDRANCFSCARCFSSCPVPR